MDRAEAWLDADESLCAHTSAELELGWSPAEAFALKLCSRVYAVLAGLQWR